MSSYPTSLPPAALKVMRFGWFVAAVIILAVLGGGDIALRVLTDNSPPTPPLVPALVFGAIPAVFGWWWSSKVFMGWEIDVDDERIRVDHGVLNRRAEFVPRTRIQHVSTEQGPIQRLSNLTSLTMHTAGARTPNIDIPHLDVGTAELLRQELVEDGTRPVPEHD